ncbi:uncharacterized protein LOC117477203 isoform X2 [Trematomus bernacchii]|uniref:uncharacterized protein LOC117477203 isoform X2 n=1 Tax=Trematomus bernacchii TaxID=40690 RepID=UPI00146D5C14|nr:uncharacterized protein LOC117477203 isoform X2 [Trematomus bernacchii]
MGITNKMSLFLILLLQLTAVTGKRFFTVKVGDEVTFPCTNVMDHQDKCDGTTWLYNESGGTAVVTLVDRGQVGEEAKAKSDRLRVTENCSLGIKKVTEEDAGQYSCRQVRSGQQQGEDALVYLSVVRMTEHQDNDEVTLRCSVTTNGWCRHTVKWLFNHQDVDEYQKDMKTSKDSVTFLTSHVGYTSGFHLFTCQLTDDYTGYVSLFPFSPSSSGEDTKSTTETKIKSGSTTTPSVISDAPTDKHFLFFSSSFFPPNFLTVS